LKRWILLWTSSLMLFGELKEESDRHSLLGNFIKYENILLAWAVKTIYCCIKYVIVTCLGWVFCLWKIAICSFYS
jgi:hypothetical protein